jgi:DNA repair exonuclease SbcCD ATPase subunit
VSPDAERALADTIQAALADPASAQLLSAGHLVDGLTPPSDLLFGALPVPARPVERSDALAHATTDVTPAAGREEELALARAAAERTVAHARAAFEHAAQRYDEAEQSIEAAALAAASAQRDLTELTERLGEAQRAVHAAEVQEEKAAQLLGHAAEQRSTAEQALGDAEALLARLVGGTHP